MDAATELAAALVSPWPTWWVEAPDETTLLSQLETIGPLPQADLLEPWDEEEPWRARVLFPPMEHVERLLAHGVVRSGVEPGLLEWLDRGRALIDTLSTGGLTANLVSDATDGGIRFPRVNEGASPDFASDFLDAVGPSTHGEPRVVQVFHPASGRTGYQFDIPVPDVEPWEERRAALGILAGLGLSIDPTVHLTYELFKVRFLAWTLHPPQSKRPTEPFELPTIDLSEHLGQAELHLDLGLEDHERHVLDQATDLAEQGLSGSRPRYTGQRLLACWSGEATLPCPDLAVPHRWVAGCPAGLEDDWIGIDPRWWGAGGRQLVQLRDPLHDADWMPRLRPRDGDAVDKAIVARMGSLGTLDPVDGGLKGLRLRLPHLPPDAWSAIVDLIGHHPDPRLGPVGFVRFGAHIDLFLPRLDLEPDPTPWTTL